MQLAFEFKDDNKCYLGCILQPKDANPSQDFYQPRTAPLPRRIQKQQLVPWSWTDLEWQWGEILKLRWIQTHFISLWTQNCRFLLLVCSTCTAVRWRKRFVKGTPARKAETLCSQVEMEQSGAGASCFLDETGTCSASRRKWVYHNCKKRKGSSGGRQSLLPIALVYRLRSPREHETKYPVKIPSPFWRGKNILGEDAASGHNHSDQEKNALS